MKITKYLHSCLFVEEKNKTVLIDPGMYTYDAKVFSLTSLPNVDYILITHEHPDHMSIPFITEILQKFPKTQIISNQSVKTILDKEHISVQTSGNELIQLSSAPHEKLFDKKPPENTVFTLFGKLTDPGDSHHFNSTTTVLALPIQAPWGSTVAAVEKAMELKPKVIIPIHDWHWKDEVRKQMYERLTGYFEQNGIDFRGVETGETVEI